MFVDPKIKAQFVAALVKYFNEFRSGASAKPDYYTRIVNDRNFNRLDKLLESSNGKVVYGGDRDPSNRFFGPTIVEDVDTSDSLLTEELFGPILPILEATLDEAIAYTVQHDHPLALYGFTTSKAEQEKILNLTNSGGVAFNDAILHMLVKDAPFGGVGPSGMGAYHGPFGFKEFTHYRTVVNIPSFMEMMLKFRYAPYSDKKTANMIKLTGFKSSVPFDRNGKDVGGLRGLLAKSTVLLLIFAVFKWKGWSATEWINSVRK